MVGRDPGQHRLRFHLGRLLARGCRHSSARSRTDPGTNDRAFPTPATAPIMASAPLLLVWDSPLMMKGSAAAFVRPPDRTFCKLTRGTVPPDEASGMPAGPRRSCFASELDVT